MTQFSGHALTLSARMSTTAAVVNNLILDSAITHSTSLCLAFPTSVQE